MALLPATLSALRGAGLQQLSAAVMSAVRGAGGRRQISTSTIVPWTSRHHDFRIERYTQVKKMTAVGHKVRSRGFVVGDRLWYIVCCPNGLDKACAGHLSMFLEYGSYMVHGDTMAMVKMSIVSGGSSKSTYSRTSEAHVFSKEGDTWGWDKFISHKDLEAGNHHDDDGRALTLLGGPIKNDCLAVGEKHLKDDCLIVRCDVSVAGPCLIY
ncbi:hypothetical protein ZWY2020_015525 [Hordeum vulgare]|nr:hypothetical protein ZWY2020_015497 [Hordeum vulgare]KAI4978772.1 hypothetical protein ZWY2020_015525 [Hordeum vulgare]